MLRSALMVAVLPSPLLAQCPPGLFDYGPPRSPNAERIILDGYGPSDPLIPEPALYTRISRDVDLITSAVPILATNPHASDYGLEAIRVRTDAPENLTCYNQHYQASLEPLLSGWWDVIFPRAVNPHAAALIYGNIPGVQNAVVFPASGGFCPPDRWTYHGQMDGLLEWDISAYPENAATCRPFGFWNILTTAEGGLTIICYANCDHSPGPQQLTANDFMCFLNKFAAAEPYANCDGSQGVPTLTANDFQCYLNAFAAGCT